MPHLEKEFLLDSEFVVNITAPNKQSSGVKSVLKSLNHVSNSWQINNFTTFLGVKITLSCFKQLPLNLTVILNLMASWCSGYHYCTTSFINAWTQILRRFKSWSRRVENSRWCESMTMFPTGNKAKCLSSVNHTTKIIHHHHNLLELCIRISFGERL